MGQFAKDSASGVGQFAKDGVSGAYGAGKDVAGGAYDIGKDATSGAYTVGKDVASGIGNMIPGPSANGGGYQNSYGGPGYPQSQGSYNQGGYMQPRQPATAGQDPYSYYGAVQPRYGGCNYVPRTANFSNFGK